MSGTDEVEGLLRALIAIPSVNPRSQPPHPAAPGEADLAAFLQDWLATRDIDVTIHDALPGRPNVVAVVPGRTRQAVVLEAHTDTVEIDQMTIDPFAGTVADGRIHGRGACDTKGSLAAFLLALQQLAADDVPPPVTVVLAAVADEEHLYHGVSAFLDHAPELDYAGAVVGEPTELRAGIAHKGVVRCTIHVHGRSGHSSRPAEALSAVRLAIDVVAALEADPGTDRIHPVLGEATRTVVRIHAGDGPNVVPGHCEIDIDRRTLPGEDPHEVWRALGQELEAVLPHRVTIDEPFVVDYALDTPAESAVVTGLTERLASHGLAAEPTGLTFCSDASKFGLRGIPAVVFGPGSISQAHTDDEFVDLADVATARDVIVELIRSWEVDDDITA